MPTTLKIWRSGKANLMGFVLMQARDAAEQLAAHSKGKRASTPIMHLLRLKLPYLWRTKAVKKHPTLSNGINCMIDVPSKTDLITPISPPR